MKHDLLDLFPEPASFTLSGTGERVHTLRPVSLIDNTWVTRNLGGPAEIQEMFEKQILEKACRLVFHLVEDKTPFEAVEVPTWSDDGERTGVEKIGGYRAVMAAVRGTRDHVAIWKAIFQTVGISGPKLEQLQAETEAAGAQKKSPTDKPKSTGKGSLTSSKRSTDTRTARSAR